MRRLAPLALVVLAALLAGTAGADTFAVVPVTVAAAPAAALLPTVTPNVAGSVSVPFDLMTPPAASEQLAYPQLLSIWQQAGSTYGIPWQVLASINKVESNFGRNMGPSSAGAVGWMQFMPSTWLRWGTDANGDGVADPWNPADAIYSAARYLAAAGGGADLHRAVFAYNHADWYVNEVLGLANVYGAGAPVVLSLDRLQTALDAARAAVVAASDELVAAKTTLRALTRDVVRRTARAERTRLLSDRLALEAVAGRAAQRRAAAAAVVAARSQSLDTARRALDRAQQQSAASSFSPSTSQLFGSPSYSSGYVFPVGGGPGVVFASHSHHDYPAVDIAAPMGSPLYALADSTVVRSWENPDNPCGIGLTLQAFDGQIWTYCHLSFLDPGVLAGASLTAGQQVGLVGETGDATGPHLHLQLQPASAWPQQEPWFQSFAGTAFVWSDAGANDAPTQSARTLAIVGEVQATPAPDLVAGGGPVFQVIEAAGPQAPPDGVVLFSRPRS